MKASCVLFIFLFSIVITVGQNKTVYNLQQKLNTAQNDTTRIMVLDSLSLYYLYFTTNPDTALYFINQAIDYSFSLENKRYLILEYSRLGLYQLLKAQYAACLQSTLKGIKLSQQYNIPYYYSILYYNLCLLYFETADYDLMLKNAKQSAFYLKYISDPFFDQKAKITSLLGCSYCLNQNYDSAFYFIRKGALLAGSSKDETVIDAARFFMGYMYYDLKDYDKADSILSAGLNHSREINDYQWLENFPAILALIYLNQNQVTKAIAAARLAINYADSAQDQKSIASSAHTLYLCYEKKGILDSTLYYLNFSSKINNEITHSDINKQIQQIEFYEELNQKEEETQQGLEKEKIRNDVGLFVFITAVGFFLLVVIILRRNNRQKQKANTILQQQKQKVESTLSDLKSTQDQLIESKKMALQYEAEKKQKEIVLLKKESEHALLNERLRISRDLHDDMGSTLGSISIYSEVVKTRTIRNENADEAIAKIGNASRELIDKMSDIVWSLNPNNEGFEQLQNRIQVFAAIMLTPHEILYTIYTDEEVKRLKLSAEQQKNVYLIYKEAIHNIIKYAECSQVEIKMNFNADEFAITIKDNGKGFDINILNQGESLGGNGIKNMEARAENIKAGFNIYSVKNEGTTIGLKLKV